MAEREDEKVIAYYKAETRRPKKRRKQKPKDFPKRPLSAYNIFFKEARERLVAEKREKEGKDTRSNFQALAKDVASLWKTLSSVGHERVERLAKQDLKRYREEVKLYEETMVKKSRKEREESSFLRQLQNQAGGEPFKSPQTKNDNLGATSLANLPPVAVTALNGGSIDLTSVGADRASLALSVNDQLQGQFISTLHQYNSSGGTDRDQLHRRFLSQELMSTEARLLQLRQSQFHELQSGVTQSQPTARTTSPYLSLSTAGEQQDYLLRHDGGIATPTALSLHYSNLGIGDSFRNVGTGHLPPTKPRAHPNNPYLQYSNLGIVNSLRNTGHLPPTNPLTHHPNPSLQYSNLGVGDSFRNVATGHLPPTNHPRTPYPNPSLQYSGLGIGDSFRNVGTGHLPPTNLRAHPNPSLQYPNLRIGSSIRNVDTYHLPPTNNHLRAHPNPPSLTYIQGGLLNLSRQQLAELEYLSTQNQG
jgi:hypothetical protein